MDVAQVRIPEEAAYDLWEPLEAVDCLLNTVLEFVSGARDDLAHMVTCGGGLGVDGWVLFLLPASHPLGVLLVGAHQGAATGTTRDGLGVCRLLAWCSSPRTSV